MGFFVVCFLQHLLLFTALWAPEVSECRVGSPVWVCDRDCGDKGVGAAVPDSATLCQPRLHPLAAPTALWNIAALLWASHCFSFLFACLEMLWVRFWPKNIWLYFILFCFVAFSWLFGFVFLSLLNQLKRQGLKASLPPNSNFSSCPGNQLLLTSSQESLTLPSGQDMTLHTKVDI